MSSNKKRILLYDIETCPNLAYVWGKYQQDVIRYEHEWEMLSFAYKWLGERTVHCVTKQDFKGSDDKGLIKELHALFDEADIVIAHNGDAFDQKKSHARMVKHRLTPPSPYKSIDTLKVARKYFKFNSNRLDDLARFLDIGHKVPHIGFDLWKGCMDGDAKSWAKMIEYNKRDVRLLEKVYLRFRPWIKSHPAVDDKPKSCRKCGSTKLKSHGWVYTQTKAYRGFKCSSCGGWNKSRQAETGTITEIVN